jgi:hypothetical protein
MSPSADQEHALAQLVAEGTITRAQADAVRAALWDPVLVRARGGVLAEVAGYVGGALMLGGVVLLVGLTWSRLNRGGEFALLAAVTVALVLAGVLVAGGPRGLVSLRHSASSVRRRVAGLVLPLAAIPVAIMVSIASPRVSTVEWASAGLAMALVMYVALPSAPGLLIAGGLSGVAAAALIDQVRPRPVGSTFYLLELLVLVVVGTAWAAAALTGLARPRSLGLALGAFYVILGGQIAVESSAVRPVGYAVTLFAGVFGIIIYWWERATVLLVAAVIALTLFAVELVNQLTGNAVAGPVGLLIGGGVLVGASAFGFWLRGARERAAERTPAVSQADDRPGGQPHEQVTDQVHDQAHEQAE